MKRLGILSLFAVLIIAFVSVWNLSYQTGKEDASIPLNEKQEAFVIPSESGVFQRSEYALNYGNIPEDEKSKRSLDTYYNNRAFHGAPPSIPHPVIDERNMGENACLKCHQNGGYAEKFQAYAPITPHPEMINCRQCHVPENTEVLFKESEFYKADAPALGANNALEGSPPVIPHQLQMHENCLSCHAGPAAPIEIRVTHPERINCRQCHAANNKETIDIGSFTREKTYENEK